MSNITVLSVFRATMAPFNYAALLKSSKLLSKSLDTLTFIGNVSTPFSSVTSQITHNFICDDVLILWRLHVYYLLKIERI